MLARMIKKLWNGKQFVSRQAFTGNVTENSDSLLNFMPIMLGQRLPTEIRDRLIEALQPDGRFVTPFGPAMENPKSPLYMPNGYWHGPVWPGPTLQIVDGLRRAGADELASEIAQRYCNLCVHADAFAENFNALTGEPQCDPENVWTASVFLVLAHAYLKDSPARMRI